MALIRAPETSIVLPFDRLAAVDGLDPTVASDCFFGRFSFLTPFAFDGAVSSRQWIAEFEDIGLSVHGGAKGT